MKKDDRYEDVKTFIEIGKITEFRQIITKIPKTVVRHDLSISAERINKVVADPGKLTADEIILLSKLIEVPPVVILQLIITQCRKR